MGLPAAKLKEWGWSGGEIQEIMEERKREGNCLFVFALVCKGWRKGHPKVKVLSRSRQNQCRIRRRPPAPGLHAVGRGARQALGRGQHLSLGRGVSPAKAKPGVAAGSSPGAAGA